MELWTGLSFSENFLLVCVFLQFFVAILGLLYLSLFFQVSLVLFPNKLWSSFITHSSTMGLKVKMSEQEKSSSIFLCISLYSIGSNKTTAPQYRDFRQEVSPNRSEIFYFRKYCILPNI